MVQPAAPASCLSCITTPIVNSYPCQLISGGCSAISGVAQKIADFVTGIFTTIANFVRYCLCMSTPAAAPAPLNPAPAVSTNSAHLNTAAPAPAIVTTTPAPLTTSTAPAATTNARAINTGIVEAGKQFFLARVAGIDHSNPQNRFRERLGTEENGRRAFATVLVHAALTLDDARLQPVVNLVDGCATGPDHTQALLRLNTRFGQLDRDQKREALQRLTGAQSTPQRTSSEAVTTFLGQADLLRQQFTQDPVFCAAADAARQVLTEVF